MASNGDTSMSAATLAARLAAGEEMTLLDVRAQDGDGIVAPAATIMRVPAAELLEDPAAAGDLEGPVAVVCNRGETARSVAPRLRARGIDAVVLAGGMRGWIGALLDYRVDVGIDGLEVRQVQRPGRGCLSYLLAAGGRALVVDPAPDAGFYVALARRLGARIAVVVDTHLHADHLSGARALADATGATLRLPAATLERGVAFADRVRPLLDGDPLDLGAVGIRAISLPGHTSDMTGLLVAEAALVGGDSLFADAIARPDLERDDAASARTMARTLHATLGERIMALDGDVVLLPGHTSPGVNRDPIAPRLRDVPTAVPELEIADPDAFADALLSGMPPRPANYEAIIAANAGALPADPDLERGANSCASR